MKINEEYIKDLLVRMAYNSSAIEGNTTTLRRNGKHYFI